MAAPGRPPAPTVSIANDPELPLQTANYCIARGSFSLDPCRLDDRPPLLNLGLLQRGNRFGRPLLARGNFASKVSKLLNDARVGQRACDGTVELANDILRRALGRENPIPVR